MARALQCMDLHAIKLATSARYALLAIPPPSRPLRCVSGLPTPPPPHGRASASGNANPGAASDGPIAGGTDAPRPQGPIPPAGLGMRRRLLSLCRGEVLNFAHVHTHVCVLLTLPDSAGSHPTSGPGSVRQFAQHAPHLTATLVTDVPRTVVAVF